MKKEKGIIIRRAVDRISTNKEFMSYYLRRYQEIESIGESGLIAHLGCKENGYIRLALCKHPKMSREVSLEAINQISEFTGISSITILGVIRHVDAVENLRELNSRSLIAAREKSDTDGSINE